MRGGATVAVIIPALDEAASIVGVIRHIPDGVDHLVVVDNGSTDDTGGVARRSGARVVRQPERGYGAACLVGIASLAPAAPDVMVFLDGDHADDPREMDRLVDPIIAGEADLVLGSRTLGRREPGVLTLQARFGNWLACTLIRALWHATFTDLGPFCAINWAALAGLGVRGVVGAGAKILGVIARHAVGRRFA